MKLPHPPLRLAIGPGGLPRLTEKLSSDIDEYKRFEDIWQASTANAMASAELSKLLGGKN